MKIFHLTIMSIVVAQAAFATEFSRRSFVGGHSESTIKDVSSASSPLLDISAVASIEQDGSRLADFGAGDSNSPLYSVPTILTQISDPVYAELLASNIRKIAELNASNPAILRQMKEKDVNIHSHMVRVGIFAGMIARTMRLTSEKVDRAMWAGRFHDIGKIDPELNALANQAVLFSREERLRLRRHPQRGAEILSHQTDIPPAVLVAGINGSSSHHERWDGSGHPKGLKGTDIPLEARIVTMADRLDAIIENRAYRRGSSLSTALYILKSQKTFFDPNVWEAFWSLMPPVSRKAVTGAPNYSAQ